MLRLGIEVVRFDRVDRSATIEGLNQSDRRGDWT